VPGVFDINPATLDWLREAHPDVDLRIRDDGFHHVLASVTQASKFLTRLLLNDPLAIDVLSDLDKRPDVPDNDTVDDLVRFKQHEILRIAARDLSGLDSMEAVGTHMSRLAEDVVGCALRITGANDLIVIGMGKLGGRELNYSSDIDVMFAGGTDARAARQVMDIARRCFRVDAALRPEGRDGSLVRSIDSYRQYWTDHAQTWEFQALLKARVIAGPDDLASQWSDEAQHALWSHRFGPEQIREAREMKARTEQMLLDDGTTDREVKRGRGGIRDIEFAVQLLQLVHGPNDEGIRSPTTLTALKELASGDYIAAEDADLLSDSYRFLRTVEHRLQLVEDEQTHLVPSDRTAREHLATAMGYRGSTPLSEFDADLRKHQSRVRSAHERLYFRPLLEAFNAGDVRSGGTLETQLAAFGFVDAERTRLAVHELTKGFARSSRLMSQMMPLLLDWLSTSPDPDEGLLGLRTLISGFRTPTQIVNAFRDSPESARRLCMLLGTSRMFVQGIVKNPELIVDLGDDESLVPKGTAVERLSNILGWRPDDNNRYAALVRQVRSEQLRIAAADVLGLIDNQEAAIRRTEIAEATLSIVLGDLAPSVPIALIGMGRFGGRELSYASDLDLVVVHGGSGSEAQHEAELVAQQLLQLIGSHSATHHMYDIDYNLRPEGKKGALARSIESCADYYANWASTWERQALIRARFVAGDQYTGDAFIQTVSDFVWTKALTTTDVREIRHLKARMETERIPRGGDPEYHLKLGRGSLSDVEWTVQLLQLLHNVRAQNTVEALGKLEASNVLESNDRKILQEAWTFCDATRNRSFLITNGSGDALPANIQKLAFLARSLLIPELRDRYRQVTRRARSVMERLFYGQGS
jgi:glutamate-ammonia-ligase adenylyltransferase